MVHAQGNLGVRLNGTKNARIINAKNRNSTLINKQKPVFNTVNN